MQVILKKDVQNLTIKTSSLGFFPKTENESAINNTLNLNNYILLKSYEFEDKYIKVFFDELPLAKPFKNNSRYVLPFRDEVLELEDIIDFHTINTTEDITKYYILKKEGLVEVYL